MPTGQSSDIKQRFHEIGYLRDRQRRVRQGVTTTNHIWNRSKIRLKLTGQRLEFKADVFTLPLFIVTFLGVYTLSPRDRTVITGHNSDIVQYIH